MKTLLKTLASRLGYQVTRLPPGHRFEAFEDQQALLADRRVSVILDLGANLGATVTRYASLFPDATIYGFEPFPDTFNKLTQACRGLRNVQPQNLAISNTQGTKLFYVNKSHATNSLLPTASGYLEHYAVIDSMQPVAQVEVTSTTIEQFCQQHAIDHINILKMDIQGGELMALQGAENLLRDAAIDLVYSEVLFAKLYEGQASFHHLCAFLEQFGYVLFDLYAKSYGRNGLLTYSDALWLSPRIEEAISASRKRSR